LKEYRITYRPEDVVILITEFGYFPYKKNKSQKYNKNHDEDSENYYHENENENLTEYELKIFLDKGFDIRQLLLKIIQGRPAWTFLYPHLAKKMKKKMIVSGADYFSLEGSRGRNAGMLIYLFMYLCSYIYVYISIYIFVFIYIYLYVFVSICLAEHKNISSDNYVFFYTDPGTGDSGPTGFTGNHGRAFSFTGNTICICMHVSIYIYVYIYICILCIFIYIHPSTHTYIPEYT
jgi:hypothetical protein